MTISFPRAIPAELLVAGLSFYPDPMIEVTPLRSGRQVSVDLGPTLWRGKWTSGNLDDDRFAEVRAWYDTLLSAETFFGYDLLREYPRKYPGGFAGLTVGASPFSGQCQLAAVASNNVEVDLAALPIGFVLSVGDYIAFDYGADDGSRALHRVSAGAIADSDGLVTLEVRPHVRVGWQADAAVSLIKPSAKMIIVPGSYSETTTDQSFGNISFEAIQTL